MYLLWNVRFRNFVTGYTEYALYLYPWNVLTDPLKFPNIFRKLLMQAVAVNNFEVIKWKHPKDDDYCVLNQYGTYHVC